MKYFLIIIFSFFCCNTFSQNVIKEYWDNGNLKFERKYPQKDSIYVTDPMTGKNKIEVFLLYDSLYFYSKDGKEVNIDEFTKLYGDNEINTKQEKLAEVKRKRDDSIEEVKEFKKLDKLVSLTKKKNIPFDSTRIEIKYISGKGNDVCGNKIDASMPKYMCSYSTIRAFTDLKDSIRFYGIVRYQLIITNTKEGVKYKIESSGNIIPQALKSLIAQMTEADIRNFEYEFSNIYLKDKDNNYFKINEYKNFKLICDR
ncbi:MAG: hypothetical protein IT271_05400 [Chitinophagales bacterium]|nr:hypothetical protein [Chitinophagales bacterium]